MNEAMRAVLARLPVLTDLRRDHHACPRGRTRKQIKGRKDRAEAKVKKTVRAACVDRDGDCRLGEWERRSLGVGPMGRSNSRG